MAGQQPQPKTNMATQLGLDAPISKLKDKRKTLNAGKTEKKKLFPTQMNLLVVLL
jgi:hypothetical protein